MADSLISFSREIADLVEHTAASVVAVHGRRRFNSSGVHWSPGVIVTADHTVRTDEGIVITTGSGEQLDAELAGRDAGTDIAVLRVAGLNQNSAVPTIDRNSPARYRPGDLAIAVGRNQQSANAATGTIASLAGPSDTWRGGKLDQVIRLDVTLHPVGSGSAVVNAGGELIGIATPVLSRASVFAVPAATVDRVTKALLAYGRLPQGYLGAGFYPIALPEHLIGSLGLKTETGLMTVSVDSNAPAGKANLLIGDVLLDVNGTAIERLESLRSILNNSVGQTVPIRILRGGELRELTVTIAERK
jgi:S1-C subfamily serine protease